MSDTDTRAAATLEKQSRESKMAKGERIRIDYMPGPAALDALALAAAMFPDRPQALIDRLVICGLSALAHRHWRPPPLYGKNRDAWRLPDELRRESDD